MQSIIDYLKNNWIAVVALIFSILSWILNYAVRKDTNKLKLAEKKNELRDKLVNDQIELQNIIEVLHKRKKLLEMILPDSIDAIKNPAVVTILKRDGIDVKDTYHVLLKHSKLIDEHLVALNDTITSYKEAYNKYIIQGQIKSPADLTDFLGIVNEVSQQKGITNKKLQQTLSLNSQVFEKLEKLYNDVPYKIRKGGAT